MPKIAPKTYPCLFDGECDRKENNPFNNPQGRGTHMRSKHGILGRTFNSVQPVKPTSIQTLNEDFREVQGFLITEQVKCRGCDVSEPWHNKLPEGWLKISIETTLFDEPIVAAFHNSRCMMRHVQGVILTVRAEKKSNA